MKKLLNFWKRINQNDPALNCVVHNTDGCSHIDGMLCDFPKCEMDLKKLKELFDLEIELGINEKDRFHNSKYGAELYSKI